MQTPVIKHLSQHLSSPTSSNLDESSLRMLQQRDIDRENELRDELDMLEAEPEESIVSQSSNLQNPLQVTWFWRENCLFRIASLGGWNSVEF